MAATFIGVIQKEEDHKDTEEADLVERLAAHLRKDRANWGKIGAERIANELQSSNTSLVALLRDHPIA